MERAVALPESHPACYIQTAMVSTRSVPVGRGGETLSDDRADPGRWNL